MSSLPQEVIRKLPIYYYSFLSKFKFVIHGQTTFERIIKFNDRYTHLFHTEMHSDGFSMALIGVEDRDEGMQPDGWTDILLPVFRDKNALNGCNLKDEYLFYVDLALSGAYAKEVWFKLKSGWRKLFDYSVSGGLRVSDTGQMVSVGYVEYSPRLSRLCNFKLT